VGLLNSGHMDAELYNFTPKTQEEYNKLAGGLSGGLSMGMELPISPPRFVFGAQSPGGTFGGVMGAPPPMPVSESGGKNKRGLSVVIPGNGQKTEPGSAKMSPPPSFGIGSGSAFLTSPGGQAFPSPTAFLSELQTPTNAEGSLDGMTPGALAQFSWNSPQGQKAPVSGSSGGHAAAAVAAAAEAVAPGEVSEVAADDSDPPAKRVKTE